MDAYGALCWWCLADALGVSPEMPGANVILLHHRIAVVEPLASCEGCERMTLLYRMR